MLTRLGLFLLLLLPAVVSSQEGAAGAAKALTGLADRYVAQQVRYDPTLAVLNGLPAVAGGAGFPDYRPEAVEAFANEERADLRALNAIDAATLPAGLRGTYATLREQLEADVGMRVCRPELWNVNHFSGWQSTFAQLAEQEPVGTAEERAVVLARWSTLPQFLDVQIADLRLGLAAGYSAPQSVVRRVIAQMDGMARGSAEASPFGSPATRSKDAAFQAAYRALILERINPALRRYRDYLQMEYLPRARTGVAVSDLPQGAACYQAFLRANTTLRRPPAEVYALGERTVAAYRAALLRLGRERYHVESVPAIVAAEKADPANHYTSSDELLADSRAMLARARAVTATAVIDRMPRQEVVIEPLRPFEEAAGAGSRIEAQPDPAKPAVYRIKLGDWKTETRGEAAVVVVHEAWPGHHLQIARSRELQPDTGLSKLVNNAAYAEGWARYAEGMAEEVGILTTADARVQRRLWPAHGMVIDPGLHALHWTRRQAVAYLLDTGQYTQTTAEDLIDRIAVMPGQLTAYDSGALEIRALRKEAETALGSRFELRAFNRAVVEEGNVPLAELRRHVTAWRQEVAAGRGDARR